MENNNNVNAKSVKTDLCSYLKKLEQKFDTCLDEIEFNEDEILVEANQFYNVLIDKAEELEYSYIHNYNRSLKFEFFKIYNGLLYLKNIFKQIIGSECHEAFAEDIDNAIDIMKEKFPMFFDEIKTFINEVDKNGVEV